MVRSVLRLAVAKKYGIPEDIVHAACLSCWCPCCSDGQVQNEIMLQEHLVYGCAQFTQPHEYNDAGLVVAGRAPEL